LRGLIKKRKVKENWFYFYKNIDQKIKGLISFVKWINVFVQIQGFYRLKEKFFEAAHLKNNQKL